MDIVQILSQADKEITQIRELSYLRLTHFSKLYIQDCSRLQMYKDKVLMFYVGMNGDFYLMENDKTLGVPTELANAWSLAVKVCGPEIRKIPFHCSFLNGDMSNTLFNLKRTRESLDDQIQTMEDSLNRARRGELY